MADVSHTGTEENLIDFSARDRRQGLNVIRIVRTGQQRFGKFVQIDLDNLDRLGIGIGFTFSLAALATVRELLGTGGLTVWKDWALVFDVFGPTYQPFSFMIEAPGAFVALGLMLCLMNLVPKK